MKILIIAFCFTYSFAQFGGLKQQAIDKTKDLRDLQLGSKDGLINMNATGYFYYAMESPRPYDLVLFLTAPNCRLCDELSEEYKKVAKFYQDEGNLYGKKDEKGRSRPIFFAVVNYNDQNKQIFNQLGFSQVPNLFVSQPKMIHIPQDERQLYIRNFKWTISYTDGQVTSHKLLEFVNKRTGQNVQYKPSVKEIFTMISILIAAIMTTIGLFFGLKPIFNNPKVWLFGSLLIYTVCIAGVVYNIIHNVPFYSMDQKGNVEWKTGGGRQQLGAEGFIMASCITFTGILMILYHKLIKSKKFQNDTNFLTIAYIVLFSMTYILIQFIEQIYKEKSWYGPNFWPPAHYIKGPLMNDQGNTY